MSGVRGVMPLCLLAVVALSACAHGEAKTIVELPPLDMPAAPPRVVEATEPQQPAVVSLPDEPRTNLRPRRSDAGAAARRSTRPRTPKTDQVATEPARPVEEPPKTPPADDTADHSDPARRRSRAARAHSHRTGDERSEPRQLPGAERRRPKSVRHRQAICDPGRGSAARAQPRLRQQSRRQSRRARRSIAGSLITEFVPAAGDRSSRVSAPQALDSTRLVAAEAMRSVRPSLLTLQRNRSGLVTRFSSHPRSVIRISGRILAVVLWHFDCSILNQPRSSCSLREGKQPSLNPACAPRGAGRKTASRPAFSGSSVPPYSTD